MTLRLKQTFCLFNFIILIALNLFFIATSYANNSDGVVQAIEQSESLLGTEIAVSVYDVENRSLWSYNGDKRFPLMSTFKTLACAKLLADMEIGVVEIDSPTIILESTLITWSPVIEKKIGKSVTLKQACHATMTMSDNTAANIVIKGIGGPQELTQYLRSIGDDVTRLDRIEPDLGEATPGDKRDTTSSNAMVRNLDHLLYGDLLSPISKQQLKKWMMDNKVSDNLLRASLPEKWSIADRSGAGGYGSRGITAVVWSDIQSPIIIAIYLTQTKAAFEERDNVIAEIGKQIFKQYEH